MRVVFPSALLLLCACASENALLSDLPEQGRFNPQPEEVMWRVDRLVQVPTPEVDVLYVVDNSCSMQSSQDELAANFPIFLEFFLGSGVDYHIGVVSTDMQSGTHSGRLRQASGIRWVDDTTADPESVFSAMVQLGTSGAAVEQGLAATYAALEVQVDGYNAGFRRHEAALVVVAISDEEDQSDTSPGEIAGWLNGFKGERLAVSFSSIVTMSGFDRGDRYIAVTQDVGGLTWDITEPDWAPVLEQLGIEALGLSRRFYLSALPLPETIEVTVETGEVTRVMLPEDWSYDPVQNAVVFESYLPEPLSTVQIRYQLR